MGRNVRREAKVATASSALTRAEALFDRDGRLRAELVAEREEHLAVVRRIDAVLSMMGPAKSGANGASRPNGTCPPATGRTDTMTGILLGIIGRSPGSTTGEIFPKVKVARPSANSHALYTALHRLQHVQGRIRTEGPKGSSRYFLVRPTPEGEAEAPAH
jgi:hypothetical protein